METKSQPKEEKENEIKSLNEDLTTTKEHDTEEFEKIKNYQSKL